MTLATAAKDEVHPLNAFFAHDAMLRRDDQGDLSSCGKHGLISGAGFCLFSIVMKRSSYATT